MHCSLGRPSSPTFFITLITIYQGIYKKYSDNALNVNNLLEARKMRSIEMDFLGILISIQSVEEFIHLSQRYMNSETSV